MLDRKLHHKRMRDFEVFDHLEFNVLPRYKESHMSGDEWRTSVVVNYYFKGHQVHSATYRDMQTALMYVGAEWMTQSSPLPAKVLELEGVMCDQTSCCERATVRYQLQKETASDGSYLEQSEYSRHYRQFCNSHKRRGDADREDSDANFLLLPPEVTKS